ncbi:MAG: class I SAM-dependent methyltransferase [Betaproteobacteria bacterium]|nr:class I SAM-dependent methyltransferase [Betaproteobacteria bacterium]
MIDNNLHPPTVASFGDEWSKFDQSDIPRRELESIFHDYFHIFPWDALPANAEGFDMGCGSGRWACFVAPRVGRLNCVDPSSSLEVAKRNLAACQNTVFYRGTANSCPIKVNSQDFGYSLGVLHHVPDVQSSINYCVSLLKPGAPFLVYLYYSFDNRPYWYRLFWQVSNMLRLLICRLPPNLKSFTTDLIAFLVYLPVSRFSGILSRIAGSDHKNFLLLYYAKSSLKTLRTDSRDKFGTPLESRFSKEQILTMLKKSGLKNISFSDKAPYWCAIGFKA